MKILCAFILCGFNFVAPASPVGVVSLDTLPRDLPLPTVTTLKNPSDGYIFAAVPYWGSGGTYLVMYDNLGKPVFYRKTAQMCTDFKLHENGLITYYDSNAGKFFGLDSSLAVVDSFWVKNGFRTDEHEIKFTRGGNVLLIGLDNRLFDMSQFVDGGDRNASVVVNIVQELDQKKNVVFEWKAYEHYKLTDVGPEVNLRDPAFVHTHLNSIDFDLDSNLVISSRNLDEITKIDGKTGSIIWRLGGKNNQFRFVNDSIGFSAQHSATILPTGNLLLFDNGLFHSPQFSRAIEYKLDQLAKTATLVWSYRNTPDVASIYWGNAQRLGNGNTLISWGKSDIGATEVDAKGEKVFEMKFPADVFSYRMFRFGFDVKNSVTNVDGGLTSSGFMLEQNYPNPFNARTVIRYQVSVACFVELDVFDLLGRRVASLVHEVREPGMNTVTWDGSKLSSGTYVYHLRAHGLRMAKPMILLK